MIEKYLEIIFKPQASKAQTLTELSDTLDQCITRKFFRIALNCALLTEVDYMHIISLVSLVTQYESRGIKFCLLGVNHEIDVALKKAYLSDSITIFEQRKLFFTQKHAKIIHTHILGTQLNQKALEIVDEETQFIHDPTCCMIAGNYQCSLCGNTEYFMKGVDFEQCEAPNCTAHKLDWILIESLF